MLIVGLGNPGRKYENTRHNLGFLLVDRLIEKASVVSSRNDCDAIITKASLADRNCLFVNLLLSTIFPHSIIITFNNRISQSPIRV